MESSSTASAILNIVSQYSLYSGYAAFLFGIIGNAVNIVVFTHLKLFQGNRCAFYITAESIVDIGYIIVYFTNGLSTALYGIDPGESSLVWCRMRSLLFQTTTLASFSIICLAACDQFCSTNHRFGIRQMCTLRLARCFTFVASFIWVLHSIVFSLSLNAKPSDGCVISEPGWILYSSTFFYPVLYGLLPIVVASFFSFLAFRNVRHIVRRQVPILRRRLDRQMTAMVLTRVVAFVITSLPYPIYRIYIINWPIQRTNLLQYAIGRLLQTIFTSLTCANFVV